MSKYDPKDAVGLALPDGEYEATLFAVEDKTFNSGNEGQLWTFNVYDGDKTRKVKTNVVYRWPFQIKALAKAVGKSAEFEAATFDAADAVDSNVRLVLEVEEYNGQEKNVVKTILASGLKSKPTPRTPDGKPVPAAIVDGKPIEDDDIPF